MGFFSGTTTEIISSVVYNLAGDGPPTRYVSTLLSQHILSNAKTTIGESIVSGLTQGPGIRMKSYARWAASSGYAAVVGTLSGTVSGADGIDPDVIRDHIPHGVTDTVILNVTAIGPADPTYWADAYMAANHPDDIDAGYVIDLQADSTVKITLPNGTIYYAPLAGYVVGAQYLYVSYSIRPLLGPTGPVQTLIYRKGTGNPDFDSFFSASSGIGGFLPHIPVRINNRMISESHYSSMYPWVKKALAKAMPAGNFDKLVEDLTKNNPSIGDIDHATILFGVSILTNSNEGKAYIFDFFEAMIAAGNSGYTRVNISTPGNAVPFGVQIGWESLSQTVQPGLVTSGAKVGDCTIVFPGGINMYVLKQITPTTLSRIHVYALLFTNQVYSGKYSSVLVGGANTSTSDYEQIIIPLNLAVLNNTNLVQLTQLSCYSGYMIFHCYDEVKTKWYESGILNLVLIVVVIAVSVASGGAGASSAGVLGSASSVGAALGFSGALAILIGSLANAVASMIILRIFQAGATIVLGNELGTIIGSIAGMVAISFASGYSSGATYSDSFQSLTQPESLLKLTSSVGKGYAAHLQENIEGILGEMKALQSESAYLETEIKDRTDELFGNSLNTVNPLNFVDALAEAGESRESFLTRTLLLGPDIAQMTIDMVTKFTEYSLNTDLT